MRMTAEGLKREVARRGREREEIRRAIDNVAEKWRGIPNFSATAESFFPENGELEICLARQIPTANIECAAHFLLAKELSRKMEIEVSPLCFSFTRDRYFSKNKYKKSLIKFPFLKKGRNGHFVRIETLAKGIEDGEILSSIKTKEDQPLVDFHLTLHADCFRESRICDFSRFFETILLGAIETEKAPSKIYYKSGKKETAFSPNNNFSAGGLRPPADWYYLPYLLLFLDGKRALYSTIGDDPTVSLWFKEASEICKEEIGFSPLIFDAPEEAEAEGCKSTLYEHPLLLRENGWAEKIAGNCTTDIFNMLRHIEEQIISLV